MRYEVGSGIEKKQDDFVGEVMAQVKSQDKGNPPAGQSSSARAPEESRQRQALIPLNPKTPRPRGLL